LGARRRPCSVKKIVTKSKEVKTGSNLAESSKEGCGSKKGCFADDDDEKIGRSKR
jgi:hypothetical protein